MVNQPERSPLGRAAAYCNTYAPELLFPILRQTKRDEIKLSSNTLPFTGEDVWNAYELSWLNFRGKPVVALGTFYVPCDSPCLIESKSLKLYLNALNQTKFAHKNAVQDIVAQDLSVACEMPVKVLIRELADKPERSSIYPDGILLDALDLDIDCYQPNPSFLKSIEAAECRETLYSHLLKSNCLVTGQPDWGMLVVRYSGCPIDREGLLRYIISFRQHNEFHEQCVERIFCDILRQCQPRQLTVWARYTRRGGLDINPFRTTEKCRIDNSFEVRQ